MLKLHERLSKREEAQSLIIVAFAIIALVALVGLAVDLGLSFVERVRVRRAVDAAALAAATELPLEAAAQVRALEYLQENEYSCNLTATYQGGQLVYNCTDPTVRVEVNQGYVGGYVTGPDVGDARHIIRINTIPYRDDVYQADSASRIEVEVVTRVNVFFMRVLGFDRVSVMGRAVGENVNNLDVVLVFDNSGSMEFDTLCYGCWTPSSAAYPAGNRWPLPWNGPPSGPPAHCAGGGQPVQNGGRTYIIIEAEEYSRTNNPYDRDIYAQGMTFWVLQRNGSQVPSYMRNETGGAGALGRDVYGGYINHFPYRRHDGGADGQGSNCTWADLLNGQMCIRDAWVLSQGGPFPTPRVDYTFRVPTTTEWHLWVRGQAGDGASNLMWGMGRAPIASITGDGNTNFGVRSSYTYNGARASDWRWVRMGSMGTLNAGQTYELNLWAGAANFAVDRIIITTDPRTPKQAVDQTSGFTTNVLANTANIDNNRSGQACDPCDARFGGYPGAPGYNQPPACVLPGFPTDHPKNLRYMDWLYDDEQPIRGAVEASKRFVQRLDPRYDQIGLVSYNTRATIARELQCVRRLGPENCTVSVINNTVISSLDGLRAGGSTNIGEAILKGIEVLSNIGSHYGRPGAAHIMVLMTDGEANQTGGLDPVCYAQDYWPQNTGVAERDRAKDCVVYYARMARNNGIVIYSITLGNTADIELLAYVAELTGGIHRHAPRPEQLDPIFDELYKRIFLRLVE